MPPVLLCQVDLWTRFQQEQEWEAALEDGLHLSPRGNMITFQARQERAGRKEGRKEKLRQPLRWLHVLR